MLPPILTGFITDDRVRSATHPMGQSMMLGILQIARTELTPQSLGIGRKGHRGYCPSLERRLEFGLTNKSNYFLLSGIRHDGSNQFDESRRNSQEQTDQV